jgi:hypothetical protein
MKLLEPIIKHVQRDAGMLTASYRCHIPDQ